MHAECTMPRLDSPLVLTANPCTPTTSARDNTAKEAALNVGILLFECPFRAAEREEKESGGERQADLTAALSDFDS